MAKTAFVTGATGLLGNNLVRELCGRGYQVKALVRSRKKASQQLGDLVDVVLIEGDMLEVEGFAGALEGCDELYHTAAYFRESLRGGKHWELLYKINVEGTEKLLQAALATSITRIVHTSSIAVLDGAQGALIDETMTRASGDAPNDYYRSKMMADEVVFAHLEAHPESHITLVLPGWMHGPGDLGPTSAGQFTLDFLHRKLPGIPQSSVSFVDARDVALAMISAAERGRRGERYLAAGVPMSLQEVAQVYAGITGIAAPKLVLPHWVLYTNALLSEAFAWITGRSVQLSLEMVRGLIRESGRNHFSHMKSQQELGLGFRPVEETIQDEIAWFSRQNLLVGS